MGKPAKTIESSPGTTAAGDLLRERLREPFRVSDFLYAAAPLLVYVGIYGAGWGLDSAAASAFAAAFAVLLLRRARGDSPWPGVAAAAGVAVQSIVAVLVGTGRAFFLVHIWSSLALAAFFLLSVLVRRPIVGVLWTRLRGHPASRRHGPKARRYYGAATLFWALVHLARFVVLQRLYEANALGPLAAARIALGLPFSALAFLVTLWAIRRAGAVTPEDHLG